MSCIYITDEAGVDIVDEDDSTIIVTEDSDCPPENPFTGAFEIGAKKGKVIYR